MNRGGPEQVKAGPNGELWPPRHLRMQAREGRGRRQLPFHRISRKGCLANLARSTAGIDLRFPASMPLPTKGLLVVGPGKKCPVRSIKRLVAMPSLGQGTVTCASQFQSQPEHILSGFFCRISRTGCTQ
jgi:hypothetical protein